ncbi:DMT family transporter [Winogradskyella jejuensis]|uniref:Permease of the drug/metabolite transporter (DMT) superfamily n=1 Tax=Winogradskyella jejuensis TaxID=1089305 RepID=A0A1M5JFU0_9FLAO|nr:DMT family transporter [Winogradskyella jejuensis]SHG39442.1 Permease of the drug/metabolite transporter (DMT) superfamily [Winogradskyella jejuensis]
MPNANYKHYLHLHFLVFIAGFTAILGEVISIGSFPLVWYRMLIAGVLMFAYIKLTKKNLRISKRLAIQLSIAGVIIAAHWITFFEAINQSNVSITLAMFSSGAFFASFVEPIIFKRKILWYEILFGVIVIFGVFLITQGELKYINGILLGLASALFSTLFAVINGKLILKHKASVISFYEFLSGVVCISIGILFFYDGFNLEFFTLTNKDWLYIAILASICTAYAFIAAVEVMKYISPFTVILSYNLEPVYGIILALIFFPEKEQMSSQFYYGAIIVISAVVLDAVIKNYRTKKKRNPNLSG